ncbi:hypothetical protein H5410_014852 [Solanum commersonii]|uniref:Uncharacterized protein n=1 Tax=Solanum commersonii TaxID=4109 RepID=A0A9J5ZSN5_SOLCO|nr:hypothetical protein H5410_014852 [Solanum commersonii]
MNVHNKFQTTHAKISCALKDSNCDSPLSKMLKFIILPSNVSSSSTKLLKCPHSKDDSMFTHNFSTILKFRTHIKLSLTKMNTCMTSPICLPLFSINFCFSSLKITKVFSWLVTGLSVKRSQLFKFLPRKRVRLNMCQARFTHLTRLATKESIGPTGQILGIITYNVLSNLNTQGIGTNIKQDSTLSS